jgi:hypothetical protein
MIRTPQHILLRGHAEDDKMVEMWHVAYVAGEKFIQGFGWKTWRNETTLVILA